MSKEIQKQNILRAQKVAKIATESLRVYWVPQVPMEPFFVSVATVDEGVKIIGTLAGYDLFQYENKVKPDYCSDGGLEKLEYGEWVDWYSEDYEDINDYIDNRDGFA